MDIVCIIENKLSESEILNIRPIVDSWTDIHEFVFQYRTNGFHNYKIEGIKSKWELDELNSESLQKIWEYEESRGAKRIAIPIGINRLSNFYCDIRFNRKTILICPSPEHKYANLHEPEIANYITQLIRNISTKLGQNEILYCVDSSYPPGLLYHEAISGIAFEQLIEIGIKEFGQPNKDIGKGMKDLFFIDNKNNPLPKLTKWNWLDFKYAEK